MRKKRSIWNVTRALTVSVLFLGANGFGQATLPGSDTLSFTFDFDSDQPKVTTDFHAQTIGGTSIEIFGYTDSSGAVAYNMALALRRINAVVELLNLKADEVDVHVVGETTEFGLPENNRVVKVITHTNRNKGITELPQQNSKPVGDTLFFDLRFVNRTAEIREESMPELKRLITTMKLGSYGLIELHGHVCCTANFQLSQDRATTVARALIDAGIAADNIRTFGHGNTKPLFPETNSANEFKNMRVEVIVFP